MPIEKGNQTSKLYNEKNSLSVVVEVYIGRPQEGNLTQLTEWYSSLTKMDGPFQNIY